MLIIWTTVKWSRNTQEHFHMDSKSKNRKTWQRSINNRVCRKKKKKDTSVSSKLCVSDCPHLLGNVWDH